MCLLSGFLCGLLLFSAWWSVPFLLAFVWGSRFPVLLFILLGPDLSLSLSALSCSSLLPLGFSWLAHVSVLAPFVAWIVPHHLLVAYLLVSLHFYMIIFRSLFPTFLVGSSSFASLDALPVRSSGLSGALVALPGSLLCLLPGLRSLHSQFPVVRWCSASFPAALHSVSLSLACWLFTHFFCHGSLLCAFLDSGFLSSLAVYPVLGSSFPVLVIYSFLLRGSRGGIWILPFCSSGVLHPTLSHDLSLVSVSWDGFSESSFGYKVFSLPSLPLVSVGLSPA